MQAALLQVIHVTYNWVNCSYTTHLAQQKEVHYGSCLLR